MKNDEQQGESTDSAQNPQQALAMDIMTDNQNFLISPNIEAYALVKEDRTFRAAMVCDFLHQVSFELPETDEFAVSLPELHRQLRQVHLAIGFHMVKGNYAQEVAELVRAGKQLERAILRMEIFKPAA